MKYEVVLWDFDGVWSKDFFYKSFAKDYPRVWEFIQTNIWGTKGNRRVDKWMRAELTKDDINSFISRKTHIDFKLLSKKFLEDAAQMKIEPRHTSIVNALKRKHINVGLITNNMDVFDTVIAPKLKLNKLFNGNVFNSFAYKKLKADGLFEIAMKKMNHSNYSTALLIDDSARARTAFELRGGTTYAYSTFENFQIWAKKSLLAI